MSRTSKSLGPDKINWPFRVYSFTACVAQGAEAENRGRSTAAIVVSEPELDAHGMIRVAMIASVPIHRWACEAEFGFRTLFQSRPWPRGYRSALRHSAHCDQEHTRQSNATVQRNYACVRCRRRSAHTCHAEKTRSIFSVTAAKLSSSAGAVPQGSRNQRSGTQ
jgi:hypothetical protein